MNTVTDPGVPARWPLYLIVAGTIAAVWIAKRLHQYWLQRDCLHLYPELLGVDDGFAGFVCKVCGMVSVEGISSERG